MPTTLSAAVSPGQFAFAYLNFLNQSQYHQVQASVVASIGNLQPSEDSNARVYFFKVTFERGAVVLTSSSTSNVTYIDAGGDPLQSTHFVSSCTISGRNGAALTDKTDLIEIALGSDGDLAFAGKLANTRLIQKSGFVEGDRPGGVLVGELADESGVVTITLESSSTQI
jgi:hypothetical protein